MRYTFECPKCNKLEVMNLSVELCDSHPPCPKCGEQMNRNFMADWMTVEYNTNGCKDHNQVKPQHRVAPGGMHFTKDQADRREELFRKDIALKKEAVARGGNKGKIKMSRSIPADLFHGKVKETGDQNYWDDKKNLNRHREFEL